MSLHKPVCLLRPALVLERGGVFSEGQPLRLQWDRIRGEVSGFSNEENLVGAKPPSSARVGGKAGSKKPSLEESGRTWRRQEQAEALMMETVAEERAGGERL